MPLSGMEELFLTPAYDICPQDRTRGEVTQAMLIMGKERASQVALLLKAAALISDQQSRCHPARDRTVETVQQRWSAICDEAKLSKIDRNLLWLRQFLNPYAFLEAPEALTKLIS